MPRSGVRSPFAPPSSPSQTCQNQPSRISFVSSEACGSENVSGRSLTRNFARFRGDWLPESLQPQILVTRQVWAWCVCIGAKEEFGLCNDGIRASRDRDHMLMMLAPHKRSARTMSDGWQYNGEGHASSMARCSSHFWGKGQALRSLSGVSSGE